MKLTRNVALTLICLILGVILAWQYKSIDYNQRMASLETKNLGELKDELIREQKNNEALSKRNDELESENKKFEDAKGNENEQIKILKGELERARIIAGLVSVKGKGIVITVDNGDFSNVSESNLLNIINELRASDAQAISINDERIIAVSEIREAGKYMMINGKQMLAPFVIKAIADPEKLEHTLKMVGGVVETLQSDFYQLKVDVKKDNNIVIPKVRDDGTVIKTNLMVPADK